MIQMYQELNNTELAVLVQKRTGRRISKFNRKSLLDVLEGSPVEKTTLEKTRRKLQLFVEPQIIALQTNLPCYNDINVGRCTICSCSDLTHINCYLGAQHLMKE